MSIEYCAEVLEKLDGGPWVKMGHDRIAGEDVFQGFKCILVEFSPCKWCALVCELSKWGCHYGGIRDESAAVIHKTQETSDFRSIGWLWPFPVAVTVSSVGRIPFAEMVYPKNVISETLNLHWSYLRVSRGVTTGGVWGGETPPQSFETIHSSGKTKKRSGKTTENLVEKLF